MPLVMIDELTVAVTDESGVVLVQQFSSPEKARDAFEKASVEMEKSKNQFADRRLRKESQEKARPAITHVSSGGEVRPVDGKDPRAESKENK